MRFRLPEASELEALAGREGFRPRQWWGDYGGSPYEPKSSPFVICLLQKT